MGATNKSALRVIFDSRLRLEFHGSRSPPMRACWPTVNSMRHWN